MPLTTISSENLKLPLPKFDLKNVWIAGGAVRDSILGKNPSDVDIFGPNDQLDIFIKEQLIDWKKTFDTPAVKNYHKDNIKIQVISRDYKTIEECLGSFDFTICMFGFDGVNVWCESNALVHLFQKRLVINKLHNDFVVNSLERLQKYIQKGYTICNGGLKQIVDTIRAAEQSQIDNQFLYYPATQTPRILRFD